MAMVIYKNTRVDEPTSTIALSWSLLLLAVFHYVLSDVYTCTGKTQSLYFINYLTDLTGCGSGMGRVVFRLLRFVSVGLLAVVRLVSQDQMF